MAGTRCREGLPDVVSAQGLTGCIEDNGDCGRKIVGRGRCRKHYQRWWKQSRGQDRPPALNLKTKTVAERFWAKVDQRAPNECWPWKHANHRFGHGQFFVSPERGRVPAHSFALELSCGERCPEGMEACHHCDNPPCCNPAHIYFGTRRQNVDDMWSRQRTPRGSARTQAKLTERDVESIRVRFASGELLTHLASDYGVTDSLISTVVNGLAWKHVGGPIKTHGRPGRRPSQRKAA